MAEFSDPTLVWGRCSGEPLRISECNLALGNQNHDATRQWRNHDVGFLRFDTISPRVRQTDGQTRCCFKDLALRPAGKKQTYINSLQESLDNARQVRDSCVCMKIIVVWRPVAEESLAISTQSIHRWKEHLVGYNTVADNTGLSHSFRC